MASAPARFIDNMASITVARSSSQPFWAAALSIAYSPLTWYTKVGAPKVVLILRRKAFLETKVRLRKKKIRMSMMNMTTNLKMRKNLNARNQKNNKIREKMRRISLSRRDQMNYEKQRAIF